MTTPYLSPPLEQACFVAMQILLAGISPRFDRGARRRPGSCPFLRKASSPVFLEKSSVYSAVRTCLTLTTLTPCWVRSRARGRPTEALAARWNLRAHAVRAAADAARQHFRQRVQPQRAPPL